MKPFFTQQPTAEFLRQYTTGYRPRRVFSVAGEGDFMLNLLGLWDVDHAVCCDSDPHASMTTHVKAALLKEAKWEDLEALFCGPKAVERLHRAGRWDPDSFAAARRSEETLAYIHDMDNFYRLKRQLRKLKLFHDSIFSRMKSFVPQSFDLVHLGRVCDRPETAPGHDDWPGIVLSRLAPGGKVVVLTSQNPAYVAERFYSFGFQPCKPVLRPIKKKMFYQNSFMVFEPRV